ncbi:unnamed protein product [Brassica rapa subsp. trilocularis]
MAFFFLVCNRQDFFHAYTSALVYVLFFLIILTPLCSFNSEKMLIFLSC